MRVKGNSMSLKKTALAILLILLICASAVWAGDSAVFVDLGFSPDGRTYMFGQYGVSLPSLKPWAELFVVNMDTNNFVPNGRVNYTQDAAIKAGQDGSGVFYRLLNNNSALANRYSINFQNQGQPLYISRNENPPERGERIEFRDFISGKSYEARLIPTITGSGQNTRSSFYIEMETRSPNGSTSRISVGSPQIVRQRIASYNIKKVLIDSTGNSLIFVIEMKRVAENGFDIRYMVEVIRL
jgi:predicted secreted protein